jgi:hypothetical protein
VLAGACYDDFGLTRLFFFAWVWCVTGLKANVAAAWCSLGLTANMGALGEQSILAVARPMARLLAGVNATTKAMPASLPTGDLGGPARLIFKDFLAAHASLLHEVWALGAGLSIAVALVVDCRVATRCAPIALVWTGRRLRAAWKRWVEYSPAAVAGDLVKYGFPTGAACATVA